MARNYRQGRYQLKSPEKYKGDPTNIIYRSSWELKFLIWCDTHPSVLKFSSEETIIPYYSPVDGKMHRYFVDFNITLRQQDGTIKTYLIEVKPFAQTQPPKNSRNKRVLMESVATYQVNLAKWEAAKKYCVKMGWEFKIVTEEELGIKKR